MPAVPELKLVKNTLGPGPVNAVRTGIRAARGRYIVVVNGDLSDEMSTINAMVQQARAGHDLVCGSRYMAGGRKVGGPFVQDLLSRCANAMFRLLTRFPTADVTNSFKLYRADFLRQTPIESTGGFEFSMELAVKGYARGLRLCEVPTVWKQRKAGESRFRLLAWLRNYLRWFFAGLLVCWFGRRRHDAQSGAGPTRIEAG
jgi:glycosyltransferase involved in cell wall biosynthesis